MRLFNRVVPEAARRYVLTATNTRTGRILTFDQGKPITIDRARELVTATVANRTRVSRGMAPEFGHLLPSSGQALVVAPYRFEVRRVR